MLAPVCKRRESHTQVAFSQRVEFSSVQKGNIQLFLPLKAQDCIDRGCER